jgi:hypothetical protein
MTSSVMAALAAVTEEGGDAARVLPVSPLAIGLTAFATFLALLAVTWAFRSVANKH